MLAMLAIVSIISRMNKRSTAERARILACLCEGNSIRATARLTDVAINTVVKLLIDAGHACANYHDKTVRGITAERIQADEVWSFCGMKQKHVPANKQGQLGYGDVWCWTGIDADSKLVISWHCGHREVTDATMFIEDLKSRIVNRPQLTTDGHRAYLQPIAEVFNHQLDYAMLQKIYGTDNQARTQARYSPAKLQEIKIVPICGYPERQHISTSFAERQNLNMRMSMRRYTRLTNGHSRKFENHLCALALYFHFYNFCRIHATLKVTPAMQAGLASHAWELAEVVRLIDETSN